MRKKVLVLGANFGGVTASLAIHHALGGDVDVTAGERHDDHDLARGRTHARGVAALPGNPETSSSQTRRVQGLFGAAHEFLFNTAHQLRKAGLHDRVELTYVTAEPVLGHSGMGGLPHGEHLLGRFLAKEGIDARISIASTTSTTVPLCSRTGRRCRSRSA